MKVQFQSSYQSQSDGIDDKISLPHCTRAFTITNFGSLSQKSVYLFERGCLSRFLSLVMFSIIFLSRTFLVPYSMDGGDHRSCLKFDSPHPTSSTFFPLLVLHGVYFALAQLCSSIFSLTDPETECHRNSSPQTIS